MRVFCFREALEKEETRGSGTRRAVYGIGKTMGGNFGMARTVVHFSRPPELNPLSLCCNLPGVSLGHRFLLDMVKEKLSSVTPLNVEAASVTYIRFLDRNVVMGAQCLMNRWIITVNCVEARDELLRVELYLINKKVALKRYDDVLKAEYKEYQTYYAAQKKLFPKLERCSREPNDACAVIKGCRNKIKMDSRGKGDGRASNTEAKPLAQ